jgi:thiol-disulfide isomerase/thioredoxin
MKHLRLLMVLLFTAAISAFISCSKGGTTGGGTPPPSPNKSLTVSLDKTQISADGWETVIVTVKDESNNDVSGSSTVYLGNVALSGNEFWTSTPGTYKIKASRAGVTSPEVTLNVTNPGPSPFSQKIMVEDYTGTWCGHCPRVGVQLEQFVTGGNPNCIVVANHGPSNDPYTFSSHATLANSFGVTGYPSVWVDRDFKWNENNTQLSQQFTNRRPPLGLGFQTSVSGNTINVTARVKFDVSTAVNLKLVVYLVEDGKVYPQVNYGYYGMSNPINNYTHNGILRKTGTDLFGDIIPVASQTKGNIYEKTLALDATGYNLSSCRVIAFVVQGPNTQNRKEKAVLNIQTVKAGDNKNFD